MTDPILVRRATASDREFVAGLVSSLLESPSPAWEDPQALSGGYGEALARAVDQQDADSSVLIAEDEAGVPLGFISLRIGHDAAGFVRGHVADIAVVEHARRAGIGTRLMHAAEEWATEHGLKMLGLDVWSTNDRALGFYRRLGYSPESLSLIKPLG